MYPYNIYIYVYMHHKDTRRSCEIPLTSALWIRW